MFKLIIININIWIKIRFLFIIRKKFNKKKRNMSNTRFFIILLIISYLFIISEQKDCIFFEILGCTDDVNEGKGKC